MPTCWIIAGPNGAGKTTFALDFLPKEANCTHFINADLIAAGLSPLASERELLVASRLFLQEIKDCIDSDQDFAFETTLAGRSYLKLIHQLKSKGWTVELIYLALPSVEVSKMRVGGGHNIPAQDIERRFPRSLVNLFKDFSVVVDHCRCLFNADEEPVMVFEQHGNKRTIHHNELFLLLKVVADVH